MFRVIGTNIPGLTVWSYLGMCAMNEGEATHVCEAAHQLYPSATFEIQFKQVNDPDSEWHTW